MFCTRLGTPLARADVWHFFKRALRRADLPTIRIHDLRYTYATLMLEAGANPRVVADRLGHSSVVITLARYSHVTENMEADAAAPLARVLEG